jgi:hypothetical protein
MHRSKTATQTNRSPVFGRSLQARPSTQPFAGPQQSGAPAFRDLRVATCDATGPLTRGLSSRPGLVRRIQGSCLLAEQTGELRPKRARLKGLSPSCRLRRCSPHPPVRLGRPGPRSNFHSARRRARQPANAPDVAHPPKGPAGHGTEAGPWCQQAELSSHAPEEDHPLCR